MVNLFRSFFILFLVFFFRLAFSESNSDLSKVEVLDDLGVKVSVDKPIRRIVSLAPHLTEVLFSLGVGDRIVGTVKYSDYPVQAKNIPRLGDAFSLNVEAVLSMQADIIFAWHTGGVNRSVTRLKALGIPVFVNNPKSLVDIADGIARIALIVGERELGEKLQKQFSENLNRLKKKTKNRPLVFFQISDQDLYSVSDRHIIGQSIRHCGGRNLFADLRPDVTLVSKEVVIAGEPDLILITQAQNGVPSPWLNRWRSNKYLQGRVETIDPGLISRPSFRMLEGVGEICRLIARTRINR